MTDLANQRGGEDNITVIVVKIKSENGGAAKNWLDRISGIPSWIGSLFGGKQHS
jgi:serine/threonine protein phosphatase PrpC